MKAKRLLSLLLTAALMLSMMTPVLAASAETELPRASQTRLEETNEVVSIRLQAAGKLVYGSPFELSVVTRPADAQYIGVVLGIKGEAKGYVTLVLSDKLRTLLKMIPLPRKMSKTPDQVEEFNVYAYVKQLIDGNDVSVLLGVAEFIQWLHDENKEYLFLTNNSGYTPRELSQKLARMGLDVSEEHFYTSALATAAFLRDQAPGCSVFAIGEAGLLNALYDAGITMNDVNPDYVVVGEGRSYSLDTLTKATNLVWKGAKLIGANSDTCGPTDEGIAPACRALIAPVEIATGKQAYFCGKPNPLMMRTGLRMLGCHSGEAVMIGDRMDTDMVAGIETGLDTVLVLSGVTRREDIAKFPYRPRLVLDGVGDIPGPAEQ